MRAKRRTTRLPILTNALCGATAPAASRLQPARGESGAGDTSARAAARGPSGNTEAWDAHATSAATSGPLRRRARRNHTTRAARPVKSATACVVEPSCSARNCRPTSVAPCAARARCFRRLACSSFHSLVDTNPANLVPSFSTTCLGTGSGYSCRSTGTGVAPIGGGSNTGGSAATAGGSRPARRGDIAAARLPKGADRCGATKTTRSRLSTLTDGALLHRRMSSMKRKRAKKTSHGATPRSPSPGPLPSRRCCT
jgi:hypothetical protein